MKSLVSSRNSDSVFSLETNYLAPTSFFVADSFNWVSRDLSFKCNESIDWLQCFILASRPSICLVEVISSWLFAIISGIHANRFKIKHFINK